MNEFSLKYSLSLSFREGLKQVVANVEEQARADFAASGGVSGGGGGAGGSSSGGGGGGGGGGAGVSSYSYSRSHRTTSGGQGKLIPLSPQPTALL